jgi:hypothetical protein
VGYTYSDIDGDIETTSWVIKWYRDGGQIPIYNNLKIIPWSDTAKNEIWYYTLQVHDGENLSMEYTSPQVQILNTAPSANSVTFNPSSPTTLDDLSVTYSWNDVDSADTEANTIIRWYRNDILQPTYNDLKTVDSGLVIKGDRWNVSVQVSDGISYGVWENISIIIANTVPSIDIDSAQIYTPPSGLFTTNTLVANWNASDPDGDSISDYKIIWENRSSGFGSFNPISVLENFTEVPSAYTTKDQDWRFKVQVKDGTDWSVLETSFLVTILNSEPIVENISLSGGFTTTDDIILSYDFYDADGDTEDSIIQWKLIHSGSLNTIQGATTLANIEFTAGDMIWVVITPDDNDPIIGFPTGQPVDSSILSGSDKIIHVGNTAPYIDTNIGYPEILSDHPNGTELYNAITPIYVNYTDLVKDIDIDSGNSLYYADFDINTNVQYATVYKNIGAQYRWYKYNTGLGKWELQAELTQPYVSAFYLEKDDEWKVSIRPRDQYGFFGIWTNSTSLIIGNSYPVINGFTWLKQNPTTNDDLVYGIWYEFEYFDWDHDAIDMGKTIILWFKNEGLISGTENSTFLSNQYFVKGDQISIIIRPYDGINWALRNFTSPIITIANSPPVASNVTLGPNEAYTTSQIFLNWNYSDIDNDNETNEYIIIWYNKGEIQDQYENWTSIPFTATNKGDRWRAEIRVHDGTNYSLSYLSWSNDQFLPLVIFNTKMNITTVWFENLDTGEGIVNSTYANTTLRLDWSVFDVDKDGQVSFEVSWFENNGNGSFILRSDYGYDKTEISHLGLVKGHSWYAVIRVSDGEEWSEYMISAIITIINAPPLVSELSYVFDYTSNVDPQVRTNEFFVEDEDLLISYIFSDFDSDSDRSKIQWFVNINGSWSERFEFENMTSIPYSETVPGEQWYYIITPYDGVDIANHVIATSIFIESRPVIYNDIVTVTALIDTEGDYELQLTATNLNEITAVEFTFNDSSMDTQYAQRSTEDDWILSFQISSDEFRDYLSTVLVGHVKVISTVNYDDQDFDIYTILSFNFTVVDAAPPRVENPGWEFDNDLNPSNITFYADIIDYGSDITEVLLYYYFRSVNETKNGGGGSSLHQGELNWHEVGMIYYNSTNGVPTYSVTVPFDHNGTSREIIYRIRTTDSSGNSGIAYDIERDDPDRISETSFIYQPPGLPEWVLLVAGLAVFIIFIGSVVYVKFIRKPELVGLDKELVLNKMTEVAEVEVMATLDSHTIGVVVSFFDQRHGPIPIIVIPELLKDNFAKLVDLSDRSFSGTGFCDDFDSEIPSSYDFVLAQGLRTSVMSFGYALERPQARGGQENLTCNILVHQDVFPLVESFKEEIKGKVHEIHLLMNKKDSDKKKIRTKVMVLRKFVSSVVLSYERIYGTTELIIEEN